MTNGANTVLQTPATLLYPEGYLKIDDNRRDTMADIKTGNVEAVATDNANTRREALGIGVLLLLVIGVLVVALISATRGAATGGILPPTGGTPGVVAPNDGDDKDDPANASDDNPQTEVPVNGTDTPVNDGNTQPGNNANNQPQQPGNTNTGNGNNNQQPTDPNAGKVWHNGYWEHRLVRNAWTEEIYHEAVYNTVHHNETGHYGSRCNTCGADITGFAVDHLEETGHASYRSAWFVDSPAWDEQVLVSGAWTEYRYHDAEYQDIWHEGYWE